MKRVPARERLPSGVSLRLLNMSGLCWCRTDATVMGYVSSLLACLRERSVSTDGNPLVYQKTSQFESEIASSSPCSPAPVHSQLATGRHSTSNATHQEAQTLTSLSHYANHGRPHSLPSTSNNTSDAPYPPSNVPQSNESASHNPGTRTAHSSAVPSYAHGRVHARSSKQDTVPTS